MAQEEKVLILGALFHDIGKFEQRCTGNPSKLKHQQLGSELVKDGRFLHRFEKIVGKENIQSLTNIIAEHHNKNAKGLTFFVREADRLSASERVDKEEVEVYQDQWKHKHLASLFSKVQLLSTDKVPVRYYRHVTLTKEDYDVIIPQELTDEEIRRGDYSYTDHYFNLFKNDLESVLDFYKNENDFESLINLLLIIFEKYMWCIPDFTGSSETDISLYNHLKDVAGLAHAIYLTQQENAGSTNLNLVIGDIPGIQNYIFDVVNRKPAKILRGRSIFVQVLIRNFATIFLKELKLTEPNLIMRAGGKFYIVAPDTNDFKTGFNNAKNKIEAYLYDNFRMDLSFNCAYETFDYNDLKNHKKTFGQIVEDTSFKLLENRHKLFENRLFNQAELNNFIWKEKYIKDDGTGTDSIKCKVTDKPIREGRKREIKIPSDEGLETITVDEQVELEYKIGDKVTKNNTLIIMDKNDPLKITEISELKNYKADVPDERVKILLNPTIDSLLTKENRKKDIFRNASYIEVANYCSKNETNDIMDFEKISRNNNGAEFLTLIKGDIDNLGLIMAYGLTRDKKDEKIKDDEKDLTAISRTTTLSNHLKYYFSFFLNGFLKDWEINQQKIIVDKTKEENPNITDEEIKKLKNENRVYTIFAGGDDLMLVIPQSSAVKLIKSLNSKFNEFTCTNNEVHISYSVTHFKHHTPIRIVAEFAEDNQNEGKKFTKDEQYELLLSDDKTKAFLAENDKSGTFLFNKFVKNNRLNDLIRQADELTVKAEDEKNGLSYGLIRKLLELSEAIKKYKETDDAAYLIAYARLNYSVNRLLKDSDTEIKQFFENVLTINKEGNEEAQKLEKILHPLVCQVIYNIRK